MTTINKDSNAVGVAITIIMPSLNVAPYIRECMESVLGQSIKNIEVLCIDAGSDDGTLDIISSYAKDDDRIRIINSAKKSVGYQENLGIKMARGKYVAFLETDDYVRSDMYETLYEKAEENQLDFVKCDHITFIDLPIQCRYYMEYHMFSNKLEMNFYDEIVNVSQYPEIHPRDYSMWNGIYRRDFLIENKIVLNETYGAAYQDMGFILQTYLHGKRVSYIEDTLYYYREDNAGSSMNNPNGLSLIFQEFMYCKRILKKKVQDDSPWWNVYYQKLCGGSVTVRVMKALEKNEVLPPVLDDALDLLRKEYEEGLLNGHISGQKIALQQVLISRLLVENKELYLDHYRRIRMNLRIFQNEILGLIKKSEETVIFGAGLWGERLYVLLAKEGLNSKVVAFCDNDPKKQNRSIFDKTIISPDDAIRNYRNAYFVIANNTYRHDIYRQLLKSDISPNMIIQYKITGLERR